MKKIFTSLVLIATIHAVAVSQSQVDEKGMQLNACVGFTGKGFPVFLGLDFGVHPDITVGGEIGYRFYTENYTWTSNSGQGVWNYDHSIFSIVARADYHFNTLLELPSQWDVYAGLNLGYYVWNTTTENGDESFYSGQGDPGLGFGVQIGGRYYFKENLAINLEFHGNNVISTGKIGVSYLF